MKIKYIGFGVAVSGLISVFCLMLPPAFARTIQIQWAGTVVKTNIGNAENALGRPDGKYADFLDDNAATLEMATYSGFGEGDNIEYDIAAFANLLGINESLITQADVISFECNGTPDSFYETSDWVFSDGTHALRISYVFGDPDSAAIIALGNISLNEYANFFRVTDSFCDGDWVYILFDITGKSSVNPLTSPFMITLNAAGTRGADSPEPDAIGRILQAEIIRYDTTSLIPERLIRQLMEHSTFTAWLTRWQVSNPGLEIYDFQKIKAPQVSDLLTREEGEVGSKEKRKIYSPDNTKYLYFPDPGGEPDQEVWLYNRNGNKKLERIGCIGSSSWYDGGLWIDDEHFIILSTFRNTWEECWALIEYWDLVNEERVLYEAILNCGEF